MKKLLFITIIAFTKVAAQDSLSVQQYINQYKNIAIAEMHRTGVPASITLAQGIHESGAGKSDLVSRSNNHFGIKCKSNWTGKSVRHDDDARQECFRAYDSAFQSYKDHSDFLRNSQRYAFLFDYEPTNYAAWAKGLKQAGYATNPRYAPLLISMIEKYRLNDYTLMALNQQPIINNEEQAIYAQVTQVIDAPSLSIPAVEISASTNQATLRDNIVGDYPSGVFAINNCKVLYAPQGASLLALAIAHNISLSNLINFNDMGKVDILPQGQLIFLEKKQKKGLRQIHEVKVGETLWQISQMEGVRLSNLLQYNQLSFANVPATGEKIYLQGYAEQSPKLVRK